MSENNLAAHVGADNSPLKLLNHAKLYTNYIMLYYIIIIFLIEFKINLQFEYQNHFVIIFKCIM